MAEEVRCFLSVVRDGHPDVPIVVVSPTARPDAEDVPNRVGATLAQLRRAMEETVLESMADGDKALFLVEGLSTVDPEDLEDGMYPGDEGHRRLAAAVSKILVPYLAALQTAAEKRWATDAIAADPFSAPSVFDTAVTETTAFETAAFDTPGFDTPGFDTPGFEMETFDTEMFDTGDGADHGDSLGATSDFVSWDAAVFDDTALDFSSLEDEITDGAARNFDLPDIDSMDRSSLNDALLDALAPNGSSPVVGDQEVSTDGGPVDGGPDEETRAETMAVADGPDELEHVDTAHSDDTVHRDDTVHPDDTAHPDIPVSFDDPETFDDPALLDTVSVAAAPTQTPQSDGSVDALSGSEVPTDDAAPVNAHVGHSAYGHDTAEHRSIGYAANGHAANGHAPNPARNDSSPGVTRTGAGHSPTLDNGGRRDAAPVDIAVADMVVAALSIATNGADDVIFVQDSGPSDELR